MTLLIALLLAAPVNPNPGPADVALLLASYAVVTSDCLQSIDMKNHTRMEADPLVYIPFGRYPSDNVFLGLGVSTMLLTTIIWWNLPPKWRWAAPVLVIALDGPVVYHNARTGLRVRF